MQNCFHFPPPRKSGPGNFLPSGKGIPTEMMCKEKTLGRHMEILLVMPQRSADSKGLGGPSADDVAGIIQLAGNTDSKSSG